MDTPQIMLRDMSDLERTFLSYVTQVMSMGHNIKPSNGDKSYVLCSIWTKERKINRTYDHYHI